MARARKVRRGPDEPRDEGSVPSKRELIVIARQDFGLRATADGLTSATGADTQDLEQVLAAEGAVMRPLFGSSEGQVAAALSGLAADADAADVPDLTLYYHVDAPDESLDALAERLRVMDGIETAYVKPAVEPPMWAEDAVPSADEPPAATPDFSPRQIYLNAAPAGIDARFAWTRTGGGGANVRIVDVEGAWRFSHEDLSQNQGGVVGGTPSSELIWRNHGTAVIGAFSGDRNPMGVVGICPDANVSALSVFPNETVGSARAIRQAADRLRPGDILLIELHRPGPRFNFQPRADQRGYIGVEWWPDDFDAVRFATLRGIIVVEAAGNGGENLDDALYNARPDGFPASWTNPFNRGNRDSGAILVGAGAPPPGTHGQDHGPDRSRLDFSNFGALIDVQGWGREVTTTGGVFNQPGDLQGGTDEDRWYTDTFSGTSSASPIVVGALGCLQGVLRAENRTLLTPATARQLLRSTGSPQQDAPGRPASQRIGNRPDLRQMIVQLTGASPAPEPANALNTPGAAGSADQIVINVRSRRVIINVTETDEGN